VITVNVGDVYKYMPTSTVGKVTDVVEKGGKKWALLDFTNLYYDADHLTKADISEYKEVSFKERERDRDQKLRSVEDYAKTAEDVNIDMFMPSGGG